MLGFTEQYITPFAVALKAPAHAIGALAAFPNLFAAVFQLCSTAWTTRLQSRKRFIVLGVLLQASWLLPMALLPYAHLSHRTQTALFIVCVVCFVTTGATIGPVWGSLMTDHIPSDERGRYFGWRNQRLGLVTVVSHATAGVILYLAHPHHPVLGFTVLCLLALAARVISAVLLTCMEDPQLHATRESHFTFWMFIRRFRESNFVRFTLFAAGMTFAVNLSGPFLAVHILRDLRFNYLLYTILSLCATLTSLYSMRLWGEHADHVGNVRVLRLTSTFLPLLPILWIVSSHPLYLLGLQVFAGFIWGGFNLSVSNFIYDAVSPPKRIRCLAYFNVINGTALSLGAIAAGFLASHLPPLRGFPLRSLFLLSGCARLLVLFALQPTFKEVRATRPVRSLDLFFSVVGVKPLVDVFRRDTSQPSQ